MEDNKTARIASEVRAEARRKAVGERVSSVRELCATYQASPVTVERALGLLLAEGVIETRPGRGTFVAQRRRAKPGNYDWQTATLGQERVSSAPLADILRQTAPGVVSLAGGYLPEELQPTKLLAQALGRAARDPSVWGSVALEGLPVLRRWFSRQISPDLSERNVIICPGGQAALATTFRSVTRPGDAVMIESPTYLGAILAARSAGLRLLPVACDEHGLRTDLLADVAARSGAKLVYCQPTHQNPTGATLPQERRTQLLEVARSRRLFVIEDDWARDLTYTGPPPPPLARDDHDGNVIYIRSLTKPAGPGLRIAALSARGVALDRLRNGRIIDDFWVPKPLQQAAYNIVSSAAWPRHLRHLHAALKDRRDALTTAATTTFGQTAVPLIPQGGFHLWLTLPDHAPPEANIIREAWTRDLIITPGAQFFPAEPPAAFLRLSYATTPPSDLTTAITTLRNAITRATT